MQASAKVTRAGTVLSVVAVDAVAVVVFMVISLGRWVG
jgi:hypothetical protein